MEQDMHVIDIHALTLNHIKIGYSNSYNVNTCNSFCHEYLQPCGNTGSTILGIVLNAKKKPNLRK